MPSLWCLLNLQHSSAQVCESLLHSTYAVTTAKGPELWAVN